MRATLETTVLSLEMPEVVPGWDMSAWKVSSRPFLGPSLNARVRLRSLKRLGSLNFSVRTYYVYAACSRILVHELQQGAVGSGGK